jgi:hypothetical protein
MDKLYTMVIQKNDAGEHYIEIPQQLLYLMDWQEGTKLEWTIQDNKIMLDKKK